MADCSDTAKRIKAILLAELGGIIDRSDEAAADDGEDWTDRLLDCVVNRIITND